MLSTHIYVKTYFQWAQTDRATWYYLWVDGPAGNVIKQWYEAPAVYNEACSVTPDAPLASGEYIWWVQIWNPLGYGLWSQEMRFRLRP
jgi:hypothetical protein